MFLHWTPAVNQSNRSYFVNSFTSQSAAETLTTQAKFGTYSANVRGAGFVRYFAVPDFDILTDDFAIEFWYWLDTAPPVDITMLAQSSAITQDSGSGLTFYNPSGGVNWSFLQKSDGTMRVQNLDTEKNLGSISTASWHHIAVSRTSGTLETYLDGVRITTNTYTDSVTGGRSIWFIGFSRPVPNDSDPGYFIDGFRLTIGSNAGYTGTTITPPTSMPAQVLGQTRLRLNFEGSFDDIPG